MIQKNLQLLAFALSFTAPGVAAVIRVDSTATGLNDGSSWPDAFVDLQSALAIANPGDEIWVAAVPNGGSYKPSVPYCVVCGSPGARHATFRVRDRVRLYGGFAGGETSLMQRNEEKNVTILSGDLDDDDVIFFGNREDNAFHVVTLHNVTSATKLSGFRITAGRAEDDESNDLYDRSGSAVLIVGTDEQQSSPHVTRCRVDDNWSDAYGGGVAVFWETYPEDPKDVDPVRIVNCSFHANIASFSQFDPPAVYGWGGGLSVRNAAFEIMNCVFDNNDAYLAGGGVFADWPEDVADIRGIITNSTFSLNKGPLGGAAHVSDPYTDPNDVVDPIVALNNSICWQDFGALNAWDELYGDLDVSYSDIQKQTGAWPSISYPGSNINDDPMFCDAGNEQLGTNDPSSPILDAGLDALVPDDNADVNDNSTLESPIPWDRPKRARLVDLRGGSDHVDMGAFELPDATCWWDLDDNGAIGLQDLTLFLSQYGTTGLYACPCAAPDFDCNGSIGLGDLTEFLSHFGDTCPNSFAGFGENPDVPSPEFVEWARQASVEELLAWRDEWNSARD